MECSVTACERPAYKRQMCNSHYIRWRRHGDPSIMKHARYEPGQRCAVEECERPVLAKVYCKPHYARNAKYGDPMASAAPRHPWPERFWSKVDVGDCWLWMGTQTKQPGEGGYGQLRLDGRMQVAHRVSYELLCGPIPSGMSLDHLCRVRLCVNPDHLEVVMP